MLELGEQSIYDRVKRVRGGIGLGDSAGRAGSLYDIMQSGFLTYPFDPACRISDAFHRRSSS